MSIEKQLLENSIAIMIALANISDAANREFLEGYISDSFRILDFEEPFLRKASDLPYTSESVREAFRSV